MKTLFSIFVFFSFCSVNAQNSQDTLSIYFEFNSHALTSEANESIKHFNSSEHGSVILVVAHCDTVGTPSYNIKLANRRLKAVLGYVDSTAKISIAEGEKNSSQSKHYDAGLFRRVDIIYTSSAEPIVALSNSLNLRASFNAFIEDPEAKKVTIDLKLLFYQGESILLPESGEEVLELYRLLKHNPTIEIHLHGHVCCGGNYVLSKNRANAVFNYCLSKGISSSRMKYTGHSNSQPKVWPELTLDDRDANRRVSVEFTKI